MSPVAQRTLEALGTPPSSWTPCTVTASMGASGVTTTAAIPTWHTAPTPYATDHGRCGLCGHPITHVHWIRHDGHQWILHVGSECVTQIGTGASGAAVDDAAADELARTIHAWVLQVERTTAGRSGAGSDMHRMANRLAQSAGQHPSRTWLQRNKRSICKLVSAVERRQRTDDLFARIGSTASVIGAPLCPVSIQAMAAEPV